MAAIIGHGCVLLLLGLILGLSQSAVYLLKLYLLAVCKDVNDTLKAKLQILKFFGPQSFL